MKSNIVSVVGEGRPFWEGPPSQDKIHRINVLTIGDTKGRLYYRERTSQEWRRLISIRDYERLNIALGNISEFGWKDANA